MRGNAAKRWVFTINNPAATEERELAERVNEQRRRDAAVYCVYGRETGETGTPHLQGYIHLARKQRLSWLKANVSARAHWEISRGTIEEAVSYCKKDGDFVEIGEKPTDASGKRSDLDAAKEAIDLGATIEEIASEHFPVFAKYERAITKYIGMVSPKRDWVTEVFIFYGATGSGKTRKVHHDESSLWVACDNSLKWFDGYAGQEAVLFDDFVSVKNERFGFLLQLLDRYPMQVPIKGGFVNWCPRRVYFTSNLRYTDWFTGVTDSQFNALRRRVTKCVRFHGYTSAEERGTETEEESQEGHFI